MIRPVFYNDFTCLADRCVHSCCKGWEIDIDPDTAEYYEGITGKTGEEIRANIFYDEEGCHFRMRNDSCPFLEESGLCRLIKTMGEDALCDVCALHPRFFFDVGEKEFAGLGLCCEGVCDLLMTAEGELLFTADDTYSAAFTIRELLGGLNIPVPKDADMKFSPHSDGAILADLIEDYRKLEPIDDVWEKEMDTLWEMLPHLPKLTEDYRKIYRKDIYQRVFDYILYRQLELLVPDSMQMAEQKLKSLIAYARSSTQFIFMTDALWGDTRERIRRWSEEVEYSTENVGICIKDFTG